MKHRALLIGVDLYRDADGIASQENTLNGAVNDVRRVERFLATSSRPPETTVLIAPSPPFEESPASNETPSTYPTLKNVTDKLKVILQASTSEDALCVYLSGHGTRIKETDARFKRVANERGDLALVPPSPQEPFVQYFHGQTIAYMLEAFVAIGVRVTLVLDCCHSGSVLRSSADDTIKIRELAYDPEVDRASPPPPLRSASESPDSWFVNPHGYTILSACGPTEKAGERDFGSNKGWQGFFSYHLLEALESLARFGETPVSHSSLMERITVEFKASRPQQTPWNYGHGGPSFFGMLDLPREPRSFSLYRKDGQLWLNGGALNAVRVGDILEAVPSDTFANQEIPVEAIVKLRVASVQASISSLEFAEPLSDKAASMVETGWTARLKASSSDGNIRVRVKDGVYQQLKNHLRPGPFVTLCVDGEKRDLASSPLLVDVCDTGAYVILDENNEKLRNIPNLMASAPSSTGQLLDTLQHLAIFKYFEAIGNPKTRTSTRGDRSDCVQSLISYCFPENDQSGPNTFHVMHNDMWRMRVKNYSSNSLYVTVFNLTELWGVRNALVKSHVKEIEPFLKGEPGTTTISLRMRIDQRLLDQGITTCKDIFKIFVSKSQPTYPLEFLKPLNSNTRGSIQDEGAIDTVEKFIESLSPRRRLRSGDECSEDWTAQRYIIVTEKEK